MTGPTTGPMTGPTTALTMPVATLERLADATRTPLPWHEPEPMPAHQPVPRLLVDALARFGRPEVLVTLDVLHPGGRLRSWQRLAGSDVTAVSVAGTDRAELAWFAAERWPDHLTRTATLAGARSTRVRAVVAARAHG
ncbi:hypothetical protein, partial [Nocardioides sp.]|uniref:hypothetical protein n=1 Tax=Nocardioides sp. TaxID=35761 RepID=UPI002EDA469F